MFATNRTKIRTRTSQCLSAAVLIAGLAVGSTPTASAEDGAWDIQEYWQCLKDNGHSGDAVLTCCVMSDGEVVWGPNGSVVKCQSPPAREESVPTGKPGVTPLPQVQGEQGPGAPVTPVPVAPGSGIG
jgi:hypothetical protein